MQAWLHHADAQHELEENIQSSEPAFVDVSYQTEYDAV